VRLDRPTGVYMFGLISAPESTAASISVHASAFVSDCYYQTLEWFYGYRYSRPISIDTILHQVERASNRIRLCEENVRRMFDLGKCSVNTVIL